MNLETVLSFKEETLSRIEEIQKQDAYGLRKRSLVFNEGAKALSRGVAVGVAPADRSYKLAIRVQHESMKNNGLVEDLIKRYPSDIDLRVTGILEKMPIRGKSGKFKKLAMSRWYRSNRRPLLIGSSIAHASVTGGTLGAFVTKNGKEFVLSNNHVLANENAGQVGEAVLQRAQADGGMMADQVGSLSEWIQLSSGAVNTIDAAIAEVLEPIECEPTLLLGMIGGKDMHLKGSETAAVPPGGSSYNVFKLGRTTGATAGKITAFNVDKIVFGYDMGPLTFNDCIEIESNDSSPFSEPGDSGALIVNENMKAVGLLFGGGVTARSKGKNLTYANPIEPILGQFGVQLIL